jgi:peptidoglycan/LPS O-acetylase OafA/YrhL
MDYIPLGALRFYLAFAVFLGHGLAHESLFPSYQGLGFQTSGVAVFFVVSGYVVLSAFFHFYHGAAAKFLANRFLRIFPPFWAIYTATIFVFWLVDPDMIAKTMTLTEYLGNMTLVLSYLQISSLKHISQAWTLVVEVQFYIASIAIFTLLSQRLTKIPMIISYLAICVVAYGFVLATDGHNRFYGGAQFTPYFALGAAIYCHHQNIFSKKISWLMIVFFTALSAHEYDFYIGTIWRENPFRLIASLIFIGPVVAFIFLAGRVLDGPYMKIDRWAGDLTYHLYLCHLAVFTVLNILGYYNGLSGLLIAFVIAISVSFISFYLTDKPIRALRSKLRGRTLY